MKIAFAHYSGTLLALPVVLYSLFPISEASAQAAPSDNAQTAPVGSSQTIPNDFAQEVLIKKTLTDLGEASISGDFGVVLALSSKQFQDTFSGDNVSKLKEGFKFLADPQSNVAVTLPMKPIAKEPAKIDADGDLVLAGYFDTNPSKIIYNLEFAASDGAWKLIGVDLKLGTP